MRAALVVGGLLCLALAPARAEDVRVESPAPDSVSITVYRDLFALITETRTVDLPAGPVTLVFEGVADTLLPQSAVLTDVGRPVAETNYDHERITPDNLLRKSIGRRLLLTRTHRRTGRVTQVPVVLEAANTNGVVFRGVDGVEALYCSGMPEQLTFDSLPEGLGARPRLSVRLADGPPGRRQVRVSYLAHGFSWRADYVANLPAPGSDPGMELRGWLTLENLTTASFRDAQVQVVAGRLNLLDANRGGTSRIGDTAEYETSEELEEARDEAMAEAREEVLDDLEDSAYDDIGSFYGCYPLGTTGFPAKPPANVARGKVGAITAQDIGDFDLESVIVTGFRASLATREQLADYQMYRLPGTTDLGALQTKQVAFLHRPEVRAEKFYALRLAADSELDVPAGEALPLEVTVGWQNREREGLGEALPGGRVQFFESSADGLVFTGSAKLGDTPVGAPVELAIAQSLDLGVVVESLDDEPDTGPWSQLTGRIRLPVELRVVNAKASAVIVEIRQGEVDDVVNLRITGASQRPTRKAGDYAWRLKVPARGESRLRYQISGRVPD